MGSRNASARYAETMVRQEQVERERRVERGTRTVDNDGQEKEAAIRDAPQPQTRRACAFFYSHAPRHKMIMKYIVKDE